ncbi:MAG: TIGR03792 family protein [Actinobacteria bacterium]|nr:TIGR03792 family protein [Actinomycetota bacterium]
MSYDFVSGERRPVEVLVFEMDPAVVEEFLRVDHEVWTLGEATLEGHDRIPFVSKEAWLDDTKPGLVTLIFVWESLDEWLRVGEPPIQQRLQAEFDAKFPHPVRLVSAPHEDSRFGIHRVSRFERK